MSKILRVAAGSHIHLVAGAIAGQLREDRCSVVQAIGVTAVYKMLKATITAQSFVEKEGMKVSFIPSYESTMIDEQERTVLRFTVTAVDVNPPLSLQIATD